MFSEVIKSLSVMKVSFIEFILIMMVSFIIFIMIISLLELSYCIIIQKFFQVILDFIAIMTVEVI